ncbi:MAG TPA: AMP-binding protein, partial [Solirubrobacteraceae bacterium]|nr:AMP-binding protein [Solirubrobacteraceae bacterium]
MSIFTPSSSRRRVIPTARPPAGAAVAAEPTDPRPRTLIDVVAATAAAHPGAVALDAVDRRLTYAELQTEAEQLAGRLADHGVGTGDRVIVGVRSGSAEL